MSSEEFYYAFLTRTYLKIVDGMNFHPYKSGLLRLRDDQWEQIRQHFPEEHILDCRPGRKPVPTRAFLEAVLWILNTGAQWYLLPPVLSELQNLSDPPSDYLSPQETTNR